MNDPQAEARRWLAQAQNDLAFARHALEGAFFHQAFTRAQAERALSAGANVLAAVEAILPAVGGGP